jgi:hypothetical protein
MRALPFTVALLATLALTAGCASIKANLAETAKYQALADRVTDGHVTVRLVPGTAGHYVPQSRSIELGADLPDPNKAWVLAHELGHYTHGDDGPTLEKEMAANEAAMGFLQAWGWTEAEAVNKAERVFLYAAGHPTQLVGAEAHAHDWCREFHALAAAHPAVAVPASAATVCPNAPTPTAAAEK